MTSESAVDPGVRRRAGRRVAGAGRAFRAEPIGSPPDGRHASGRPRVHAQQRRVRQEIPARDAGVGRRIPRLRQRRLAGHPAGERDELARPAARDEPHAALSQQRQRHIRRCHAEGRAGRRPLRHGRCHCRLRQRRLAGHPHDRSPGLPMRQICPHCHSAVDAPDSATGAGSARRRCGSTTTATATWICLCAIT